MTNNEDDNVKSALLLVDLQNDFCSGGALAVQNSETAIDIANQAITYCQQNHINVIASQDWHPATHLSFAVNSGTNIGECGLLNGRPQVWWPVHCVQNQPGAKLHPQLNQAAIDAIFTKGENPQIDSYSAFFDNDQRSQTQLHSWLQQQQIQKLFILGIATDYCVKFTVLDALRLGYSVKVITDGCRAVNLAPQDGQLALQEMADNGAALINLAQFCTQD